MQRNKLIVISIISIAITLCIGFNLIYAYYTDNTKVVNKFKVGNLEITVTEPHYNDNGVIKPNEEITKDPTFSNTGEVSSYIRAQVYVPISQNMKYVDCNENVVVPNREIELLSYTTNSGWELVTEDGFYGFYKDEEGNRYKVYTYKFIENGNEKVINPGETISTTLFDKVKVINYLDTDENTSIKLHVSAIAVQSEGGTAEEMWTVYKNQNGATIEDTIKLADVVKVGDYVNYDANSGLVTPLEYTTDSTLTGDSTVSTYSSSDSLEWRVLSVDKDAGIVELIATSNLKSLYLSGRTGYMNAENILNDIGAIYGHGKGAVGGRSVNIEDIEQYSSYDPYTYTNSNSSTGKYGGTRTYTSGTFTKGEGITGGTEDPNDSRLVKASSSNPVTVTQTYYYYNSPSNYFENKNAYNALLSGRSSFWLASRYRGLFPGYCDFGVRYANDGNVRGNGLYISDGGSYSGSSSGVVPVVSLKSNIPTSGKDASGAWDLCQ